MAPIVLCQILTDIASAFVAGSHIEEHRLMTRLSFAEAYAAQRAFEKRYSAMGGLANKLIDRTLLAIDDAVSSARIVTAADAIAATQWLEHQDARAHVAMPAIVRRVRGYLRSLQQTLA
jgi:hypothetical protein